MKPSTVTDRGALSSSSWLEELFRRISQTKDCLHKRINTYRITNADIGEQEKDRVYAPLRF